MGRKTPRAQMTEAEREMWRRRDAWNIYQRAQGVGGFVDARPMQAVIREWVAMGITMETISQKSGVCAQMVRWHNSGTYRGQPIETCLQSTRDAILTADITEADIRFTPALGTRRRVQAMVAIGYPIAWQARQLGLTPARLHHAINKQRVLEPKMVNGIRALYGKYGNASPADAGIEQRMITRTLNKATKYQFAPPHCWDADTIDNPDAAPEWTGECGTERGYRIHERDGIPHCPACKAAFGAYRRGRERKTA
jgi:hypothetical protein